MMMRQDGGYVTETRKMEGGSITHHKKETRGAGTKRLCKKEKKGKEVQ